MSILSGSPSLSTCSQLIDNTSPSKPGRTPFNISRNKLDHPSRVGRPLARGRGLLERRVAPVPRGRMLTAKELEAVTGVGVNVTEELEAASLADEEGPPLGHRQERALPGDQASA